MINKNIVRETKREILVRYLKTVLFFVLLSVNLYLDYLYLKEVQVIPETEYMEGKMLGVFLLQLFFSFWFVLSDLWLHNNKIRMIAIVILVIVNVAGLGYYLCCAEYGLNVYDANNNAVSVASCFYLFWLFQSCLFIYLLLAMGVSCFIRKKSVFWSDNIKAKGIGNIL